MIRHIVSWKLNGADEAELDAQTARIAGLLEPLEDVIDEVRSIAVVRNVLKPGQNHDAAVIADFDDAAGLEAYIVHPSHQVAVAYLKEVTVARAAVDFVV